MNKSEREKQKAELLIQVQQQRLDLSAAKKEWIAVIAPYDRGWRILLSMRHYFMIAGSALALWNIRKPGKIMGFARQGVRLWSTWRIVRTSLDKLLFNR